MDDLPVHAPPPIQARPMHPGRINEADAEPAKGMVPDHIRRLAWFLDDAIPFIGGRRIGLDGFLSFIPGIGDAAGFGLAGLVVLSGVRAGCTWPTIARMLLHALGESFAGMIPVAGPIIAFVWKANNRNLRIIEKNLADREATRRESWKVLLTAAGILVLTLVIAGLSVLALIYTLWSWIR